MKRLLIIYQHRVREMDNALLISAALKKHGWEVDIKNDAADACLFKRYDMYLLPCLYNDKQYDFLRYRFNVRNSPVLNLRYEQGCSKNDFELGFLVPQETARYVDAISWGSADKKNCIAWGMPANKLHVTGQIALDFFREEFKPFWKDREEMEKAYSLPSGKKILLFISSLALADDPIETARIISFFNGENGISQLADAHTKTRQTLIEWFTRYLSTHNDACIIYRPHPSEKSDIVNWNDITRRFEGRLRIIREDNIKQWIITADVVLTWMSTSIIECYAAQKSCLILRPAEATIPLEWDVVFYNEADTIKTYEQYEEKIEEMTIDLGTVDQTKFPVPRHVIEQFYDVQQKPSYLRIVEVINHVYADNMNRQSPKNWVINQAKYWLYNNIAIKLAVKKGYSLLSSHLRISIHNRKLRQRFAVEQWEANGKYTKYKFEDQDKQEKLDKIVDGY